MEELMNALEQYWHDLASLDLAFDLVLPTAGFDEQTLLFTLGGLLIVGYGAAVFMVYQRQKALKRNLITLLEHMSTIQSRRQLVPPERCDVQEMPKVEDAESETSLLMRYVRA